jgi:hypothetical protein
VSRVVPLRFTIQYRIAPSVHIVACIVSHSHPSLFVMESIRFAVSVRWEAERDANNNVRSNGTGCEALNRMCCCCAKRVGNMFILCSYPDGSPILVAGPCWPFCMFITTPLVLGISALVGLYVFWWDTSTSMVRS